MLNENNIYDTWLKSSNRSAFDKIDKELESYQKNLDKKLMKLRNHAKDDLAEILLANEKSKQIYYMSLVHSLPKGEKLGQEEAKMMLELGMGKFLTRRLEYFQGLDKKIAEGIMQKDDKGYSDRSYCLCNIESFVECDRSDIAKMALNCSILAGQLINDDIESYPGFDRKELAKMYLCFDDDFCRKILENFEQYKGYITIDDFSEIPAEIFYETHCLEFVFDHLDDLGGNRDSFLKLIKDKYGEPACDKLKKLFDIK